MTSTTAKKKEIVDFLWDWADNHTAWAKLLINRIVTCETELSLDDRDTIFKYYLESLSLHETLPSIDIPKPTYSPSSHKIKLLSLSSVEGVNRLEKDQVMEFSQNITIFYGENGTGKTGYSRILKSLGMSYDDKNQILPDIFTTPQTASALIKYSVDGIENNFDWKGKNRSEDLQNISIFNSNCVHISLSDRALIVTPSGFHLFSLVTNELKAFEKMLDDLVLKYPISLSWTESLHNKTPQYEFISSLSSKSQGSDLNKIATFTAAHEESLQTIISNKAHLNKTLLQTEINSLSIQITELESVTNIIRSTEKSLNKSMLSNLIVIQEEIKKLEKTTQKGLNELAKDYGIKLYASDEFRKFIDAAENYIKLLNDPTYPQNSDICIYCQQPLDSAAINLLSSYRALLNDTTQVKLAANNNNKDALTKKISSVNSTLEFHQATFGHDENNRPLQPELLIEYNQKTTKIKEVIEKGNFEEGSSFDYNYSKLIELLSNKKDELITLRVQKLKLIAGIDDKAREYDAIIFELEDRRLLCQKKNEIEQILVNLKVIEKLKSSRNVFNTAPISKKTSDAREMLVKQNYDAIFDSELRALKKSSVPLTLNFSTDKGKSKVSPKIQNYSLTDILSEGEQKAISLAVFLTELQLDSVVAPVIFDDPVNSLDHRIIDIVAERLIKLSQERQVIIFTHSILLLYSMIQLKENWEKIGSGLTFRFFNVKNNKNKTGIIDDADEVNSFGFYKRKIEAILNNKKSGEDEDRLSREGYGFLRSAIEIMLEAEMFQNTIKRYRKGIAFPSLLKVRGNLIDSYKSELNIIYEKCCASIIAHSNPTEVHTTPTIDELRADYDSFKKIRAEFAPSK